MAHRGKSHKKTPPSVQAGEVRTSSRARNTSIEGVMNEHLAHCKLGGLSPKTLRYYADAAGSLREYMVEAGIPLDLRDFQPRDLRAYLGYLQDCGLSEGGVHAVGRALRAMWNWAIKDDLLERSPFDKVKLPKNPKRIMPVLQPDQFGSLVRAAKEHPRYTLRNVALFTTMYDTGVRVGELVTIELSDIKWDDGKLSVIGKGNKQRYVPVGRTALQSLHRYIHRERAPGVNSEPRVFLNRFKEPLDVSGVQQELDYLSAKVGLKRAECSPHTFRRGFAVQFLRNGGDVFQLQQILGHESLEMTRRYVRYLDVDLKDAHVRNSPVDRHVRGRR